MGIMCRKRLPLAKQYWKDVDVVDKETIYKHILDCFDMGLSQTHVKECVDDFFKESFREIRFSLHQQYRSIAPGLSKSGNSPDWVTQDVWEVLCDRFESEKFQIRSMKNKDNRKQEVINHRCGSRSLERMVELQSQQPQEEGSIALTDDEIADQVLGIKSGYDQGLDHGVVPPSSRLSGSNCMEADELRRRVVDAESAVRRLQVQQEQETNDLRKKFDAQREEMQQQSFFVRKAYGTAAKWSWWFRQHSIKVIVGDETSFMRITSTLEMWLYASRRLVGASKFI